MECSFKLKKCGSSFRCSCHTKRYFLMFLEFNQTLFALSLHVEVNAFQCRDEGAEAVLVGGDHPAAGVPGHRQPAVQVRHSPDGRLPHALHPRLHRSDC